MLTTKAIELLESRHIDPELAARLGLSSFTDQGGGEGIQFPYIVGAETVNNKYRTLDKRFRQDKDAVKAFFNFNVICDPTLADQPLIITEGEFDAIAAIQAGFPRVVSVPDGAPKEEIGDAETTKYAYLDHAKAALKDVREIVLATDGDGPGTALMNDLALRLGKARCKWVRYPKKRGTDDRLKDLNDVLIHYGDKGVRAVIDGAQWCKVDGIYRMSELPPYHKAEPVSTGFPFLEGHYRVRRGDFCVITGVPNFGKSTFVNDLCCRLAEKQGWVIAMASFEQHPQADHRRALREWYCARPERECLPEEIKSADAWIDRHFVFIVPSDDDLANLQWTLDKCAAAVIRNGASVVVIDPWNELDHDRPSDMSLTEYTGKAIKEFKRLARSLDIHVIVVAHPTKLSNPGGETPCPGLYDISDSAHWANKPDVGIVIHKRDPAHTAAMCKIVKSRYHEEIGRPGTVWMEYDRRSRRFNPGEDPSQFEQFEERMQKRGSKRASK
ncbi:bifunctional DNA primase/helicase [Azospirillum sp. TSO5]|uniref:bifunctional DNA primase/helicase n=1 Tax=Azospirillum sp. TSO5 TaxID=716760 RepID=UPI000D657461|nr:bifunctional DNA primase/helicase [Azospirillum sp. TSO5]